MLPSRAQKTKNLVLSQSQGCSTMTLGTTNHNHIGANQFGYEVGIQRRRIWPAIRSGMKTDVFLIQNQIQSRTNQIGRSCCQSIYDRKHTTTQSTSTHAPLPHALEVAGGPHQTSIGIPRTTACMTKPNHK